MKVYAFMHGQEALIWNAEAVVHLRREWHIIGGLIGALPQCPRQNAQLGLPLKLMPEEVTLLKEKGVLELLMYSAHVPTEEDKLKFQEEREKDFADQYSRYIEHKQPSINKSGTSTSIGSDPSHRDVCIPDHEKTELHADPISGMESICIPAPKKQHLDPDSNSEAFVSEPSATDTKAATSHTHTDTEEPLSTSSHSSSFSPFVHIIVTDPRPATCYNHYGNWRFPDTDQDKLKFTVFKDLWHQGYWLTSGLKYGGDFLVYNKDPAHVHASFIAVVLPWKQPIGSLVSLGRLGAKVKKNTLICSVSDNSVKYITLQWTGIT